MIKLELTEQQAMLLSLVVEGAMKDLESTLGTNIARDVCSAAANDLKDIWAELDGAIITQGEEDIND